MRILLAILYVGPEKANFVKIYSGTEIANICLYWRLKRFLGKGMKRDYWGVIEFYINVVIKVAEKLFISLNIKNGFRNPSHRILQKVSGIGEYPPS